MPDETPTYLDTVRARQAEARTEVAHDLDEPRSVTHLQRVQAIVDCQACDDDGYAGDQLCQHRTFSTPETRAAAKEALRVALTKRGEK